MFKSSVDNYMDEYKKTDYVYYNAMLTNDTKAPIEARLNEYRSEPIVINPKDYYLSVVRFNVPVSLIPIFVYPTQPNGDPDDTLYSVTIQDSLGVYHKENLVYTFLSVTNTVPNIYKVQHFLDMINTALYNAWTVMTGVVPSTPPYIVFNQVTKLFSLIAENDWVTDGPSDLKIFMNTNLFLFFEYWEIFFRGYGLPDGNDFQIFVKNNGNNAITSIQITPPNLPTPAVNPGYIITQEQASLDKWSAVRSIVFLSNTIAVKPEYITSSSGLSQNSGDNSRSILTDFEPPLTGGEILRGYLQYYPQGPYRLIDMTTDTNLKNLDFQLFWQDNRLKLHKIYINESESITIKIMFVRKSAYRNMPVSLRE